MASPTTEQPALYSSLASDPDFRQLVELFVGEMPGRIDNLLRLLREREWPGLRRAVHQLKGAAGGYGFGPISQLAAHVEDMLRHHPSEDEIRQAVDSLVQLCRRASARLPMEREPTGDKWHSPDAEGATTV